MRHLFAVYLDSSSRPLSARLHRRYPSRESWDSSSRLKQDGAVVVQFENCKERLKQEEETKATTYQRKTILGTGELRALGELGSVLLAKARLVHVYVMFFEGTPWWLDRDTKRNATMLDEVPRKNTPTLPVQQKSQAPHKSRHI